MVKFMKNLAMICAAVLLAAAARQISSNIGALNLLAL